MSTSHESCKVLSNIPGTRVFFCCLVFFVVGSLKDEPGRPVSE